MKILAFDSTAPVATVCITDDDKLISLFTINNTMTHSETLLPMIKSSLEIAGVSIEDIDLFACSKGPGSFTGVRIGICTLKGLSLGRSKPCVGVSTLEALSYNLIDTAPKNVIICPVMDARHNTFFNALFLNGKRLCDDRCIDIGELNEELITLNKKVMFVGDGYELAKEKINYDKILDTPQMLIKQNAYSVACLANKIYKNNPDGDYSDLSLSPDYLRPSQAERTKENG